MSEAMKARLTVVAVSIVVGLGLIGPALAAPRVFTTCKAMNAVYSGGVAKSAKAAAHPSPFWISIRPAAVDSATYTANKRLDRDNDGIACEVAK
jgi:hypothetical protein